MKRIALISDTHNYLDPLIYKYARQCDEIWHAGDVGTISVCDELVKFKPVRAVFGNIDGQDVRINYPEVLSFTIEGLNVLMLHIGGYPGHYTPQARMEIAKHSPGLFISGHSHILKVMPDKKNKLLHINPGAAGVHGFHAMKTMVRFIIENGKVSDLQAIELGKRA